MASFETWDQKNLAQFAYESQKEMERLREERNRLHHELIVSNNRYAHLLHILKELMDEYVYFLELYNRTPLKQKAYLEALEIFQ